MENKNYDIIILEKVNVVFNLIQKITSYRGMIRIHEAVA